MLTKKQTEVFNYFAKKNPKILICSGAKRAGKTFILTQIFLCHVSNYKNRGVSFIIGGADQSTIRRNVLNDLELILGRDIKLNKSNSFSLFGNRVYCFGGANSDSWKSVRGFTSAGAFLNEATALHDAFIKEVLSRCSYNGARIFMDTNPENPMHTVKVDYIDKSGQLLSNGTVNIKAFNFSLFDNNHLSEEYIESIIQATPSGMFTDRDIYGKWVSAEGVVYKDFTEKNYVNGIEGVNFAKYFCGVDWGYEHYGSIVLIGVDDKGIYYVIKEIAEQHKEIDFWVDRAKEIKEKYGNITFYCDSARPEHVKRFQREHIRAVNANKAVIAGIEEVAKLIKSGKLLINKEGIKRFNDEIYNYAWAKGKDEPVKVFDDVLDAIRYAIYSENNRSKIKITSKASLF